MPSGWTASATVSKNSKTHLIMNKQYFLLVKSFTSNNSKPIEKALVNKLIQTLDQTLCNKSMRDLELHVKDIMVGFEKEFKDTVTPPLMAAQPNEIICHSFGLFKITAYEVRNAIARWHVQMPYSWMPLKYTNWPALSEEEKKQAMESEMRKIQEFLETTDKTLLLSTFSEKFEGWRITLLDFGSEALKTESEYTSADFGVKFTEAPPQ